MHSFSLYEWLYSEKIVQNISFPPWLPTVKEKSEKPTKTKPKKTYQSSFYLCCLQWHELSQLFHKHC